MVSLHSGWALDPLPGILIRRPCDDRDKCAEWCSYEPRDTRDFGQAPEARREAYNRLSLRTSEEGINPVDTLVSGFRFQNTFLLFSSHQFSVICWNYRSCRKLLCKLCIMPPLGFSEGGTSHRWSGGQRTAERRASSGVTCPQDTDPQLPRQEGAGAHLTALLHVDWGSKPFNSH